MSLLNTLKEQLNCEPLFSSAHIVVAYSGGVDSHVLLHALHNVRHQARLSFKLSAIHIHHGLSQHADKWQAHCEQVCSRLDIEFKTANVNVQAAPRQSLEAQARDARYKKLIELAPADSQVLLAQHQDDQLETFLLQLKRGAGPKGLSAMKYAWVTHCPLQSDKQIGFCRPLLDTTQQVILEYAQQLDLQWCEDESNQNTDFERNFLRHDVLPVLQNRWPEISRAVARSASLCAEQQSLLDETSGEKLNQIRASANSLHLPALKQLSLPWLHQLVRFWLSELDIQSPSKAVLSQLKPEVLDAADDATPILQWQGWQFRRFDQQLFVISVPTKPTSFNKVWQGEKSIKLPNDLGSLTFLETANISADVKLQVKVDLTFGSIEVRFGGYAAKFKPVDSDYSKPVKQWFKQWKIAPWLRESVVFVMQKEEVLALLMDGRWHQSQRSTVLSNKDSQITITLENTP
jgi:tRNA(Ile)-lysidine synthase